MTYTNPVKTLESLPIGETLEFLDYGFREIETVVARANGVTISRGKSGRLSAWRGGENTGWCFGSETTPEQAIDRVMQSSKGWAGLATGAAIAEKTA